MPGGQIHDCGRDKKRRDLAWAPFHQRRMFALDDVEPAYARADMYADILGVLWRDFQA